MPSIPDTQAQTQALYITSYRYVLKVTPERIQSMSREQLQLLCLEQYFLLWLIIAIIRNPLAAIATRIIAIDLLISFIEKSLRGNLKEITERSRVYISGEGGIAKRLGIHANTVSKSLKNLETHKLIRRDYVYDEVAKREYLDVTITPIHLQQPQRLQDKTARKVANAGKKPPTPQASVSPPENGLTCPSCGSNDIIIVCRSCGTTEAPLPFFPDSEKPDTIEAEANPLLNKIYGVDTNNAPLASEDNAIPLTGGVRMSGEEPPLSDIAQMNMQDILAETSPLPSQGKDEERDTRADLQAAPDENQIIIVWLERRRGHGKLIYATGSPDYSKKYYNKPRDYRPDYPAYLKGHKDHILGSYLLYPDNKTFVLSFDIDDPERHNQHLTFLQQLSQAGAVPLYWLRQNRRGHLEIYFDRPVDPAKARAWCISVCPELKNIDECYPAGDKQNQPIAWPLYQRKGQSVFPCRAKAMFPGGTQVVLASALNLQELASLIAQAVTPATLVEALDRPELGTKQKTAQISDTKRQSDMTDRDIARLVIADFNRITSWEEIIALCGGCNREGKFAAVWRGERTPSVKVDKDEAYACDYGRNGNYPKKLDKYEIWCLVKGGREFKKADLAARCQAYRDAKPAPPLSPSLPAQAPGGPPPVPQEARKREPQAITPEIAAILTALTNREGEYQPQEPCERCGCPFTYNLAGSRACCRCLPVKGLSEELHAKIKQSCQPEDQITAFGQAQSIQRKK